MSEPRIENVWTDCRFIDRDSMVWRVVDYWPVRWGSGLVPRYPGDPRAIGRDFRRYASVGQARGPTLVELRRYTFSPVESRGLVPNAFQRQLDAGQELATMLHGDQKVSLGRAAESVRSGHSVASSQSISGIPARG